LIELLRPVHEVPGSAHDQLVGRGVAEQYESERV
jgi:hypothetical protein